MKQFSRVYWKINLLLMKREVISSNNSRCVIFRFGVLNVIWFNAKIIDLRKWKTIFDSSAILGAAQNCQKQIEASLLERSSKVSMWIGRESENYGATMLSTSPSRWVHFSSVDYYCKHICYRTRSICTFRRYDTHLSDMQTNEQVNWWAIEHTAIHSLCSNFVLFLSLVFFWVKMIGGFRTNRERFSRVSQVFVGFSFGAVSPSQRRTREYDIGKR